MTNEDKIYKKFLDLLTKNKIYYSIDSDLLPDIETVVDEYITGGVGGNTCWETEQYTIYGESPSYENIYRVFTLFFGQSDETYNKILENKMNFIGEYEVKDTPDYYGNYIDKCYLFLNLKEFFKIIPAHILRKLKIEDVFENEI
jgi:hypothetical protein